MWFDVGNSPSLSPEHKELVMRRLGNRIGKDGAMKVMSQKTRSKAENRELAVEWFVQLMQDALRQVQVKKRTPVIIAAKLRRLEEKEQPGLLKHRRLERVPVED